jgi:hypothetical protein
MIPTKYKSRLPRTLSYPLGAEAISRALAGAPHAEDVQLSFHDQAVWPAREFQRFLREGLSYRILELTYLPPRNPGYTASNAWVAMGECEEKWSLIVYAVLRERRQVAGRLLREQGLPAVADWLRLSTQPAWKGRQHRIELLFDPVDEWLSVRREDRV